MRNVRSRLWWPVSVATGVLLITAFPLEPALPLAGAQGSQRPTASTTVSDPYASFSVRYGTVESRYRINLATVLPNDSLTVAVIGDAPPGSFSLQASQGQVRRTGERSWIWRGSSRTGLARLTVAPPGGADSVVIQTFVLVPRDSVRNGVLNGYRIGSYPKVPLRDIYRPPVGFIEVTPENVETLISPHFRLRHFVCKQVGDYPKYVVLEPFLLLKLELILRRVQEAGYPIESFFIMSGYRTPYYNKLIRNSEWSRHKWGDAADIFVDESPRDGVMDDLNRDGRIDVKDAELLARIIDEQSQSKMWQRFLGGLGIYRTKPNHGPFVHIDIRGRKARWRGQ